jgi:ABC-type spermidine/putrescine transport system permease subunit II
MVTPSTLYRRMPEARQRSRRILVVAAFAGFPLQIIGSRFATGEVLSALWGPITIALFSATIVGAFALYGYGQGRMDRRERLDERQRSILDQALVVSYGVLTTVIVIVAGLLAIYLSLVGPIQLEMGALTPWLIAIGVYVPLLPFAALAWIEPDAPGDDDL